MRLYASGAPFSRDAIRLCDISASVAVRTRRDARRTDAHEQLAGLPGGRLLAEALLIPIEVVAIVVGADDKVAGYEGAQGRLSADGPGAEVALVPQPQECVALSGGQRRSTGGARGNMPRSRRRICRRLRTYPAKRPRRSTHSWTTEMLKRFLNCFQISGRRPLP
jgi:hypothetical protein